MPNPYNQSQNPWLYSKWNQQYGGGYGGGCGGGYVQVCTPCFDPGYSSYDPCYNPCAPKRRKRHHGGGCAPKRRRRRNRCRY